MSVCVDEITFHPYLWRTAIVIPTVRSHVGMSKTKEQAATAKELTLELEVAK